MEQPTQVFNRIMEQKKLSRVRYTPMNAKEVNGFFIRNEMYPQVDQESYPNMERGIK